MVSSKKRTKIQNGIVYRKTRIRTYCLELVYVKGDKKEGERISYIIEVLDKMDWESLELLCRKFPYFFSVILRKKSKQFKISQKFKGRKEMQYVLLRINKLDILKSIDESYVWDYQTAVEKERTIKDDANKSIENKKAPILKRKLFSKLSQDSILGSVDSEFKRSSPNNFRGLGTVKPSLSRRNVIQVERNQALSKKLKKNI